MEGPALHDRLQPVSVLQDRDVAERVAVDEDEVGEVAGLDLAEFAGLAHDLPALSGGRQDGLHRGEAEKLDEVLQGAGVGPVRAPGEPVVSAGQYPDTPLMHLAQGL